MLKLQKLQNAPKRNQRRPERHTIFVTYKSQPRKGDSFSQIGLYGETSQQNYFFWGGVDIDKLILKFISKCKGTEIVKTIWKKSNPVRQKRGRGKNHLS